MLLLIENQTDKLGQFGRVSHFQPNTNVTVKRGGFGGFEESQPTALHQAILYLLKGGSIMSFRLLLLIENLCLLLLTCNPRNPHFASLSKTGEIILPFSVK